MASRTPSEFWGLNHHMIGEAHELAAQADRDKRDQYKCARCGKVPNLGCVGVARCRCSKCASIRYCSRECQVGDWKRHKDECQQLQEERKDQRKAKKEQLKQQDAGQILRDLKQRFSSGKNGDDVVRVAECREIIHIIRNNIDKDLLLVELFDKKLSSRRRLHAIHSDSNTASSLKEAFYETLGMVLDWDIQELGLHCLSRSSSSSFDRDKKIILPSWHMAMDILRAMPDEEDFLEAKTNDSIGSCSAVRCAAYFEQNWKRHLNLCVALWDATQAGNPSLFVACKDLWRQLPLALVHDDVAKAVFQAFHNEQNNQGSISNSNKNRKKQSSNNEKKMTHKEFFAPLIRMLELDDQADDLETLTNQVAAMLVVQSRRQGHHHSIMDPNMLEQALTSEMDHYQMEQWQRMSLPIAMTVIDKGSQLEMRDFQVMMGASRLPCDVLLHSETGCSLARDNTLSNLHKSGDRGDTNCTLL